MSRRRYHHPSGNSTAIMRMACAILFCLFFATYLYFYQADTLAYAQHVWSGGATHYSRFWGCVTITLVLFLLQRAVGWITQAGDRMYAFSFFPSFLFLGILTDCAGKAANCEALPVYWFWLGPLLSILLSVLYRYSGSLSVPERRIQHPWLNRFFIRNVLLMFLLFIMCAFIGDHSETLHYRLRAKQLYDKKNYQEVLEIGRKSEVNDSVLSDLRVMSLGQLGMLGDRLFEYPVYGNIRHIRQKHSAKDIRLCSFLIDRNLPAFAANIGKYYKIDSSLPRHYREALVLYMRRYTNTSITYKDNVMDADFQDYLKLSRQMNSQQVSSTRLKKDYGNTYWYYFFFASSTALSQSVSSEN